jgi:predicted transposase/invertase (TIGR01784 family)
MQFLGLGSKLEEDKMSAILQDVPEVQAAYNEYKQFTSDPVMQEKVRSRERFLTDQYLNRADALAEGRAEGRVEGRVEGEKRRSMEVARNMKVKGYPVADIAELTGLSLSKIEKLV